LLVSSSLSRSRFERCFRCKRRALLESVGFTLRNGQPYLPNGQPLKISMMMAAGRTDVDTAASNAASKWTAFGIPTRVIAMDPTALHFTFHYATFG